MFDYSSTSLFFLVFFSLVLKWSSISFLARFIPFLHIPDSLASADCLQSSPQCPSALQGRWWTHFEFIKAHWPKPVVKWRKIRARVSRWASRMEMTTLLKLVARLVVWLVAPGWDCSDSWPKNRVQHIKVNMLVNICPHRTSAGWSAHCKPPPPQCLLQPNIFHFVCLGEFCPPKITSQNLNLCSLSPGIRGLVFLGLYGYIFNSFLKMIHTVL